MGQRGGGGGFYTLHPADRSRGVRTMTTTGDRKTEPARATTDRPPPLGWKEDHPVHTNNNTCWCPSPPPPPPVRTQSTPSLSLEAAAMAPPPPPSVDPCVLAPYLTQKPPPVPFTPLPSTIPTRGRPYNVRASGSGTKTNGSRGGELPSNKEKKGEKKENVPTPSYLGGRELSRPRGRFTLKSFVPAWMYVYAPFDAGGTRVGIIVEASVGVFCHLYFVRLLLCGDRRRSEDVLRMEEQVILLLLRQKFLYCCWYYANIPAFFCAICFKFQERENE